MMGPWGSQINILDYVRVILVVFYQFHASWGLNHLDFSHHIFWFILYFIYNCCLVPFWQVKTFTLKTMNLYLKNVRYLDLPIHPITNLKPNLKNICVQGLLLIYILFVNAPFNPLSWNPLPSFIYILYKASKALSLCRIFLISALVSQTVRRRSADGPQTVRRRSADGPQILGLFGPFKAHDGPLGIPN
jgi:hypothetical protein